VTASVPTRFPLSRLNPMPRCRLMVAGVAALLLHLTVLAVLLFVPGRALRDDDASQPVMVTLVTEPPVAQVPAVAAPLAEPPPVEAQPEPPPPIAVPPPEPPPVEAQPETAPALDIPPPPPEAPPAPDIPPPPPAAIPAPDTSPPRVPKPIAKTPRPRLAVPAHPVAPPPSAIQAEPRPPASAAPLAEPTSAVPRADIIGPYRNSLAAHVQTYQRYPALARTRREEGLVVLHVTIQRDGQIAAMSIEHGSGSEALDREALATLKRADPLPPIPAGVPGATIDLEFPLRFHLE
jgi:periplasmic protein TonB